MGDHFPMEHDVSAANRLFSLDGRVALITGASRGLGLAMAEGLAQAGRPSSPMAVAPIRSKRLRVICVSAD